MCNNIKRARLTIHASEDGVFIDPRVLTPGPSFSSFTLKTLLVPPVNKAGFRRALNFGLEESRNAPEDGSENWNGAQSLQAAALALGCSSVQEFIDSSIGVEISIRNEEVSAFIILEEGSVVQKRNSGNSTEHRWDAGTVVWQDKIFDLIYLFLQ
jgi:hypothetical protein